MPKRPFKILGVQQIAVGGLDKKPLRHFWIDVLGLSDEGSYRSESENVDEGFASGCDDYIYKPINSTELLEKISKLEAVHTLADDR